MAEDDLIGPPDSAMLSQPSAADAQTSRFVRQRKKYEGGILDPPTEIAGDDDYAALEPGRRFVGPDKQIRVKPYEVKSDEDYDLVPEGAQFLDPEGKTRQKPVAEGVGFSADTLYQMARTPETRRQALEKFYDKDKVKQDTRGEFYIDQDGKILRPGHGTSGFAGGLTAEAAPAAGMLLGGALGGAADVETGVVPGAAGGAVLGAMAGRQLNNVVLGLAGIHETLGEQFKSVVNEAGGVALGEAGGRVVSKIPAALATTRRTGAAVRDTAQDLRANLPQALEQLGVTPERARKFLGTTQATAQRASDIIQELPAQKRAVVDFDPTFEPHGGAEPYEAAQFLEDISPTRQREAGKVREVYIPGRGFTHVMIPPSVYAPEAPMLKKIEEFDRIFRSQDVVAQSWEALYNQQVPRILADAGIGVSLEELATQATKKVSSERAGHLSLQAARRDMAHDDAALENARRDAVALARRPVDQLGGEEAAAKFQQEGLERLKAAHARAQDTATRYIQAAAQDLRDDIEMSIRMAAGGEDTGDLNRAIAAKYQAWSVAIRQRASTMYDAANDAAGGARIDISSLSAEADGFLKSIPEQVRQKYPSEIANLSRIAQALEREGQNEPVDPTMSFGDLHKLRSWFRYGIDYQDMTPDMKGGSLKFFEKKINDLLHEPEAGPQLKNAVTLLDQADAFYKQNVPFLSDKMVQGTIDMLKSGEGANPEALARMFFNPERTASMRRARDIVGENLWKGVQAADVQHMLDNSRMVGSDQIDGAKFAQQVEQRLRDGILETGYDAQLARRVQKIVSDTKKLAGQLPVTSDHGDTISTLMRKIEIAQQEADKFAEMDPLAAMRKATQEADVRFKKASEVARKTRREEPLHHLYEESQSHLAVRAADKILGSQDLIMAAATKFGRDSPEFNALRQVYAQRFFQREFPKTAGMRAELGGEKGMTEEVQALMFPGITRDQMVTLAKNMEFLFSAGGTDVGGALAAASRVLHPEASFPIQGKALKLLTQIPLSGAAMRFTLGKFYALAMDATTHPNFINWLANRLEGDAFARAEARAAIQQRIRMGQLLGRAVGQQLAVPQQGNQQEQPETMQ